MSVLDVLEWPEKVLDTRADEVTVFDAELESFTKDMADTMHDAKGIGLAANQVGVLKRVLVINIPFQEGDEESEERGLEPEVKMPWHDKLFVMVNPVLKNKKGKTRYQEGCLSFPEVYDFVERSENVVVEYQDVKGKKHELEADGLMAICIQHEIDHLDGIVFFKRMSRLKANTIRRKMMKRASIKTMKAEVKA